MLNFGFLKSLVWLMQCGVLCYEPSLQGEWRGPLGELHGSWHKVGMYISGEALLYYNYLLILLTC